MKFNIPVDIDWIEEDGSVDDAVKAEIISGVKAAISKTCLSNMEAESKKAIEGAMISASQKIEDKAVKFVDDWLENEIEITDQYGDLKEKGTLKDIIKGKFNDILNKKVNSDGNFGGHNANTKLIDYLTGKHVSDLVVDRLKSFGRDIDKTIDAAVKSGIKERVSDRFAEMVVGAAAQDHRERKALISEG